MLAALKHALTPTEPQEPLPVDASTLYDLLRNERRRTVIECLTEERTPITVRELAITVATEEYDKFAGNLTDQEVKRVYISLYQTHLGRLADAGIIEYDESRVARVDDTPLTERVYDVMQRVDATLNGGEP